MQKKPYVPPRLTEYDTKDVKRILIVDDDGDVRERLSARDLRVEDTFAMKRTMDSKR